MAWPLDARGPKIAYRFHFTSHWQRGFNNAFEFARLLSLKLNRTKNKKRMKKSIGLLGISRSAQVSVSGAAVSIAWIPS
jgi:predicted amidophosphoribosyltransferase